MPKQPEQQFKLKSSTLTGRSADNEPSSDPQPQLLNAVVDHRSIFFKIQVFDRIIEAVCDSGASVSCLSSAIFDSLQSKTPLKLSPSTTQLKAANQLPIETRGTVNLPVQIAKKVFDHTFHVLVKSESDCLIGLDFLEDHKCDPMFSKRKLLIGDTASVPLYHMKFEIPYNKVFRVASQDTISIPSGHSAVVPAFIPDWKRPPIALAALFEPNGRFNGDKALTAPDMLFNYSEDIIPVVVENSGDEPVTLYKDTTLGTSKIVPKEHIQNVGIHKPKKKPPTKFNRNDEKYNLIHVKTAVDNQLPFPLQDEFGSLIDEFSDVFSKNEWDIGKCDVTSHKIDVYPGSRPVKLPNRRMPLHYKEDLREKLDAFLEKDLITPCHSPYSAPAMLVPKKNGKLRLVIDYRQLNNQTIKSCWPIPSIEEIFDTLEGSAYFTTIDMSWGFYQLPMDIKSQDLTAFSTPFGSFKWLRMPMGLTGSPNTFQSLMECVLMGLTWKITVPYLDDCIIFSKTAEEHLERLRQVFERFRAANLKINPTKCEFFKTRVPFLGHIISKEGLEADPEKVAAVKNFPIPTSPTEVKSFLGLCSHYRRYVQNFADIARPLHKASESKSPFMWTPEAHDAFETLKRKLMSTPILALPSMTEPFILYTDASMTAMGAVLSQVQDGQERAICFASKAFSKAQTRYSATKRELLAVVNFTRHFRHYLLGRKFKIVTDHSALQWLHNFKDPDALTARWLEKLAAFNYEVVHRPGKSIGHADGLSRIPPKALNLVSPQSKTSAHDQTGSQWPNRSPATNLLEKEGNLLDSDESIAHCVSADFKMAAGIARKIKQQFPMKKPTSNSVRQKALWPQIVEKPQRFVYHMITKTRYFHKPTYKALRASLLALKSHAETNIVTRISMPRIGCGLDQLDWQKVRDMIQDVFHGSTVQVTVLTLPATLELHNPEVRLTPETPAATEKTDVDEFSSALQISQRNDEALNLVYQWVNSGNPPSTKELQGCPRIAWQLANQMKSLEIKDGVLCRRFELPKTGDHFFQQIIPQNMVHELLSSIHSSPTGGHLGVFKTTEKIRQRFYWPNFKDDIKTFISSCEQCQKRVNPQRTHKHSLSEWRPSYPFHHIGIDFMGPLPLSNGNQHILLIGDHFTKWYEAVPLPDQTAHTTANALLQHWICRFGCPYSIHSDQGRNFESKVFKLLMQSLEIEKTRTTAFRPQSNAVIERMNRTLQNMLAKCVNDEQNNWSTQLPYVMTAYRTSVHESTGYTPHFLVYGQEICLPIDFMYPSPNDHLPSSTNEYVSARKLAFQKAYESARLTLNQSQKRRNALYNRKVHGPLYQEGQKVLLHSPVVPVGKSPKFFSPWKGPYVVIQDINDVTYRIEDPLTKKQLVVHYDRLKPFKEPPPTSNIPTRDTSAKTQSPIQSQETTQQPASFDHDQCNWSYGFVTPPTCLTSTSATSTPPTPPGVSIAPSAGPSFVLTTPSTPTAPHHPAEPVPPSITFNSPIQFHYQNLSPDLTHSSSDTNLTQTPSTRSLPNSPASPTPIFNKRSSRQQNVMSQAARSLQFSEPRSRTLRESTQTQRKAEPLWKANLPWDVTHCNSPSTGKQKRNTKR